MPRLNGLSENKTPKVHDSFWISTISVLASNMTELYQILSSKWNKLNKNTIFNSMPNRISKTNYLKMSG